MKTFTLLKHATNYWITIPSVNLVSISQTSASATSDAIIDGSLSDTTAAQFGFNPQPHNPSNRFQIN